MSTERRLNSSSYKLPGAEYRQRSAVRRLSNGAAAPDSSTQILLAEHERLSQLYLYNADLGEKRTAQYLGIVTLAGGAILGLSQLGTDEVILIELSIGALAGIFLLGFITFFRLIERRSRSTEYLRAINRIHAYFAEHDPALLAYFSWPCADDIPRYAGRLSDLSGLRDLIALLNGASLGIMASLIEFVLQAEPRRLTFGTVSLGVAVGIVTVLAHLVIETLTLRKEEAEAQARVRFPYRREAQE